MEQDFPDQESQVDSISENDESSLVPVNPLNIDDAGDYLSTSGPLSKISDHFEERPSQIELLKHIAWSFNEGKLGVFEAGTGVGKSYAYLIPSVLWCLSNKERVVISTGTINLQSQLCDKDLPAVQRIIGRPFKYILLKGRQNYVCKRRLEDAAALKDLFDEDIDAFDRIYSWAKTSENGSKSDLSFMPPESVWSKVNSESDACMGGKCPYFNDCFVMKVRKEAADAQILVVNHHLLFADIEARMNGSGYDDTVVLPAYKRIVFDEAHGIESAATSFFSESFQRFRLIKLLNQMYRQRKGSEAGFLCNLIVLSANDDKVPDLLELTGHIRNDISRLEVVSQDLLERNNTLRITPLNARDFSPTLSILGELCSSLSEFVNVCNLVMEGIAEEDKDTPSYWESKIIVRRLEVYLTLFKEFTEWDEHQDKVFWLQKKRLPAGMAQGSDGDYTVFTATPLDIAPLMNEGVYDPMKTVVFTSATLRTGSSFNYWMSRTGVSFAQRERVVCKDFDSPFDYNSNMLFAVPNDIPSPDRMEFQQFIEMAIARLIKAANGRTLVLFTSYESLKSACNTVKLTSGFDGLILKQGDDDNAKLLDTFKNQKDSVLFATDSFWQGVDVPGESLSQVIIVKLPFTVPTDPVFTARSEAVEKRGGNSFMELSVPEAVIKFRQGAGRLIRSGTDRGVVVCLDRRIIEKRYGSIFLSSLPQCKKSSESFEDTLSIVRNFLTS